MRGGRGGGIAEAADRCGGVVEALGSWFSWEGCEEEYLCAANGEAGVCERLVWAWVPGLTVFFCPCVLDELMKVTLLLFSADVCDETDASTIF